VIGETIAVRTPVALEEGVYWRCPGCETPFLAGEATEASQHQCCAKCNESVTEPHTRATCSDPSGWDPGHSTLELGGRYSNYDPPVHVRSRFQLGQMDDDVLTFARLSVEIRADYMLVRAWKDGLMQQDFTDEQIEMILTDIFGADEVYTLDFAGPHAESIGIDLHRAAMASAMRSMRQSATA
jgi:hypothetical protein